jgi:hypothetical protein
MDLTFETIYDAGSAVFREATIDLSRVKFFDPWAIGIICLRAIAQKAFADKRLQLPDDPQALSYLKRIRFDSLMEELTYGKFIGPCANIAMNERENLNVHELMHCRFRDEFTARLESKIRAMFRNFGMVEEDEQRATALVGELGNNVFDHNEGSWPTDVRGAIIIAQNYPRLREIAVAIADPGVGFLGSLKPAHPALMSDIEAIKLGLQGVTGRVGEKRGNGLITVQNWTINRFSGSLRIHSGEGLIAIDQHGRRERVVPRILGTLAAFVVRYQ